MKTFTYPLAMLLLTGLTVHGHHLGGGAEDGAGTHYDFSVRPPTTLVLRGSQLRGDVLMMAQAQRPLPAATANSGALPAMAALFQAFGPKVKVRTDGQFLYVESDGMPAHNMMVGITAWQQQVPLPQAYTGNNAWRIPLHPVPAQTPASIKNRFLRGAIALAVNGIPIFNPQNNRGEISNEIGELDEWGGHCGRADDYHYHAAPLHLQAVAGKGQPIAYALDGYPIFGLIEPDGSAPAKLDAFNGHELPGLGYHYHSSTKYPYVNGGFHGEVTERDGQVDPQPRAQPRRESSTPLRGARITGFTSKEKSYSLKYEFGGETRYVNYAVNDNGTVKFDYVDGSGQVKSQTYSERPAGGDRPPGEPKGGKDGRKKGPGGGPGDRPPPPPDRPDARGPGGPGGAPYVQNPAANYVPKRSGNFVLRSPVVAAGGALPVEFTGDGSGISPPLEWTGAPAGTKSFAVIMHHIPGPGDVKWYWTLYNLPANLQSLPKDVQGVGTLGNSSVNHRPGYAPPHSKGPGAKTYILTVYALSAPVQISAPPTEVNRDTLLVAMKDLILDSAELKVTYDRTGAIGGAPKAEQRP
ncbi:MAG: YHYH protein [Proteobacteria bacterium]|nr:YHYH protein [Pseudomonadota bacterium]